MFQFRRFPAYAYFVQRTLTEYCSAGFPHSEIPGSKLSLIHIYAKSKDDVYGLLRQRPNRYAIRAGQNLPDKEFRYLRTVIVTAAVHRGLSSMLRLR